MEIASHSSDSFEVRRNIKVKADIHSLPMTLKRMYETEKLKIKDKGPSQSQNVEDLIEIVEENIPTQEQRMEMSADVDDGNINYEIDKNLLKYREPKTPDDETSSGEDTDKIFSPPTYKAKTKPLKIKEQKKRETKTPPQSKIKQRKIPSNKKSRSKTPDRKNTEKEKILEKELSPLRIKEIQEVPVNVIDSRDHIWMKNDHIIHFIDTKGNPVDEIDKELMNRKIYQKPKNFQGTIGQILITKKGNKKVFGIITQPHKKKLTSRPRGQTMFFICFLGR